jgi:UDPglucose 6-dehydrogenase
VRRDARDHRLAFTTSTAEAVPGSDVVFIAVGTPPGETGEADLSYVLAAAQAIGKALVGYCVVVD